MGSGPTCRDKFVAVGDALDRRRRAADDRVMSIDAAGTKYWTGHGGVVLVNDPIETIEEVARAYDIALARPRRRRTA